MENAQLGARCEELARSEGRFRDRNGKLEREGDEGGDGGPRKEGTNFDHCTCLVMIFHDSRFVKCADIDAGLFLLEQKES